MSASEEREGPEKSVAYSCRGCAHCREEGYCVEDGNDVDRGFDVRCAHPLALDDGHVGDTTWRTPAWCPYLEG